MLLGTPAKPENARATVNDGVAGCIIIKYTKLANCLGVSQVKWYKYDYKNGNSITKIKKGFNARPVSRSPPQKRFRLNFSVCTHIKKINLVFKLYNTIHILNAE